MSRYIYVLRAEGVGRIKVGSTEDVERRVAEIQAMCPVPLTIVRVCEGHFDLEFTLHSLLRKYRSHGEWFADTPETLALIEREMQIVESAAKQVALLLAAHAPSTLHDELAALFEGAGCANVAKALNRLTGAPVFDNTNSGRAA